MIQQGKYNKVLTGQLRGGMGRGWAGLGWVESSQAGLGGALRGGALRGRAGHLDGPVVVEVDVRYGHHLPLLAADEGGGADGGRPPAAPLWVHRLRVQVQLVLALQEQVLVVRLQQTPQRLVLEIRTKINPSAVQETRRNDFSANPTNCCITAQTQPVSDRSVIYDKILNLT